MDQVLIKDEPKNGDLLFQSVQRAVLKLKDYALLLKLRLSLLVLFSTLVGFWLASPSQMDLWLLAKLALGAFLIIGGANAFNEIIERNPDALMKRTAIRPLPSGRMGLREAWGIALLSSISGILILSLGVNGLTALLALTAFCLYVFAYTPLKRIGPWCVFVGAFPGAIPAMMGPVAIHHAITPLSWFLFGIVFLWQFPHFCAIAWVAREDYERAGFKVLTHPENPLFTAYQILLFSCALVGVSPLLTLMHHAGTYYLIGSLCLSLLLVTYALVFWFNHSRSYARQMMGMALLYLPLLFILMILDKVPVSW